MKLGLHLSRWNWDDDPNLLAPRLRDIATLSELVRTKERIEGG